MVEHQLDCLNLFHKCLSAQPLGLTVNFTVDQISSYLANCALYFLEIMHEIAPY